MKNGIVFGILTAIVLVASGCDCNRRSHTKTTVSTETTAQNHLLDAKDLDLQAIMGWIKSDHVQSASDLEKAINSTAGINNVDVDKDKKIDYISVKESRKGDAISLDMLAVPSSTRDYKEAVTVASVTFKKNVQSNSMEVSGGYPDYVHGHGQHYYHYRRPGLTFGDALFLAWMFSPRPMYYHPGYMGRYYAPRGVYSSSRLRSTRTTYRSQTRVSPVRRATRPKSYGVASARKVPSRFSSSLNKSRSTFKSRSGSSRRFKARSGQTNRRSSWGRRSNTRSKPSRSWGSSSTRSKPSRSWGSSGTRSRSRSWGGSSGTRSRSWGGSSGRSRSWGGSRSFGGRRRSDVSFKDNVNTIPNALDKVDSMRGVYFTWKDNKGNRQVGVIAQEVKKVVPEVVTKDKKGYLVDYAALVPVLIQAVKELKAQNQQMMQRCTMSPLGTL